MRPLEQQIINQIEKAKEILIALPQESSGDCLASGLALFNFLKKIDKSVHIALSSSALKNSAPFSFLPGFASVKSDLENLAKFIVSIDIKNMEIDQIKYVISDDTLNFIVSPKSGWFTKDNIKSANSGYKYDLIFVLGASDLESLGEIYDGQVDFFYKTNIINIDHQADNEEYGQINLIDLNAVSVTQILFELLKNYRVDFIDSDIATCLLSGIITRTRSFKTANLTPQALTATSELMALGARREEIVNRLYRSRDLNILKLWGRILSGLNSSDNQKIVWANLLLSDFDNLVKEEDLLGAIEELLLNIPEARLIVLFYSLNEKSLENEPADLEKETVVVHPATGGSIFKTRALVYSVKNLNSIELLKEYSPTGTRRTAYIETDKPLKTFSVELIERLKDKLAKLPL